MFINGNKCYDSYREIRQDGTFTGSSGKKIDGHPVLKGRPEKSNYYINETDGDIVHALYSRIFIKRKDINE